MASCVTIMIVLCCSRLIAESLSIKILEFLLSKAPVGSSASTTLGLKIKALAAATRCFCPPDICEGNLSKTSMISRREASR